jgi:hypothetical protein
MREDGAELPLVRRACSRLHLDQIRPHCLAWRRRSYLGARIKYNRTEASRPLSGGPVQFYASLHFRDRMNGGSPAATPLVKQLGRITARIAKQRTTPTIAVIMPVCDEAGQWFRSTINSVEAQLYLTWELCLGVGASLPVKLREELHALDHRDNRIRIAWGEQFATWADKANGALALASSDFIAPLDVATSSPRTRLYWVAREALDHAEADLIFSDEDMIEDTARRLDPWFKPDWMAI